MNVGDYVRIKNGIIDKISDIDVGKNYYHIHLYNELDCYAHTKDEIIKSSPNIIDLIQQGDYVNGYKVFNIETSYTLDENHNRIGEKISLDIGNDMYGSTIYIEEKDIKSIVTKECFESMEYKVGK